jgi:hypothetical protein
VATTREEVRASEEVWRPDYNANAHRMTDGRTQIALLAPRSCPYCGQPIRYNFATTCERHADLPALEPLDTRYALPKGKP